MIPSLPNEEWKSIKDFEGYYEISNLGRVKSLSRLRKYQNQYSKEPKYLPLKESILKPVFRENYPCVSLCKNGIKKPFSIHRLLGIHFIDNPDNKPHINHIDGDRSNHSINNLEWCTPLENMRHARRTGLNPVLYGEHHSQAKMVINIETGIYYGCIKDAAESANIIPQNLVRYLNGHIKINPTSFRYAV